MNTVKTAPPDIGTSHTFNAPYDRTTASAIRSVQGLNVNITETEETDVGLEIYISKGMTLFSWGEVVRVIVERNTRPYTTVWVLARKRWAGQIAGTEEAEFAKEIFSGIKADLSRQRS